MAEHDAGSGMDGLRREPVAGVEDAPDGAVVVRLAGELDLYNAHVVRDALLRSIREGAARVVVDLGEVSFLDSTALGVLIEARTKLDDRNAFRLAAPGAEARRALEVSGLDRHFAIDASVDDALAAAP